MDMKQTLRVMTVVLSCMFLAVVWCEEQQDAEMAEDTAALQPQKRSVDPRVENEAFPGALYLGSDDADKRGGLFRFGKRRSLFRFGKRGSLFRFGKRGSLFRFGKRGSLFRFGKRNGDEGVEDEAEMYPDTYVPDEVKSFHWGRETE